VAFAAAVAAIAFLGLVTSACGSAGRQSAKPVCTAFGTSWRLAYNRQAARSGNPVRILAACCGAASQAGVSDCRITVTLVGTTDRGCESVPIGRNGLPAGPGRHESCPGTP
jgi:hypothetical protein